MAAKRRSQKRQMSLVGFMQAGNVTGTRICGATKSVWTNTIMPNNARMPAMRKKRRNRGQRLPAGSEKTKGVTAWGGS